MQPISILIRSLGPADAASYRACRLEALQDRPTAFGSSYEEESSQTVDDVRRRFETEWNRDDNILFGGFAGEALVGTTGLSRAGPMKRRHKMIVWGVYVAPPARGQGVARRLLEAAIAQAGSVPGIARLELTMEHGNLAAQTLYEGCGFHRWGTEPDGIQIGSDCYAEDRMSLKL